LDLESTYKSLVSFQKRGNVTEEEQTAQCYLAARREWSLHGEEVFDGLVAKVHPILSADPVIACHFIERHTYDWEQTLAWVLNDVEPEPAAPEADNYFAASDDLLSGPMTHEEFGQVHVLVLLAAYWTIWIEECSKRFGDGTVGVISSSLVMSWQENQMYDETFSYFFVRVVVHSAFGLLPLRWGVTAHFIVNSSIVLYGSTDAFDAPNYFKYVLVCMVTMFAYNHLMASLFLWWKSSLCATRANSSHAKRA
jgi:hypothetical protein